MARIRSVHPTQWTDDRFVECSPLARLLALGLRNEADDAGIFEWNPTKLKMRLLPADNCDVGELLDELEKTDQVKRYHVGERGFGIIRNFLRFQRPRKPTYLYPIPPSSLPEGYALPPDHPSNDGACDTSTAPVPHWCGNRPADGVGEGREGGIEEGSTNGASPTSSDSHSTEPVLRLHPTSAKPSVARSPAKGETNAEGETKGETNVVWDAYASAYAKRYGVLPKRNKMVNGQIAQLIKRLGADEAPEVAAYYVQHGNQYYVNKGHSVGCLLHDAEKLRTEWATGRRITSTAARQEDRRSSNLESYQRVLAKIGEGGK